MFLRHKKLPKRVTWSTYGNIKICRAHVKVFHLAEKQSTYKMHIFAPYGETRPTVA
jgi:hypothetical protein